MPRAQFMTLARHIIEGERKHPHATGELSRLLYDLSLAAKVISLEVNKAGLVDILGFTGSNNVHGEQVKKLDMFAHSTLVRAMDHGGHFCAIVSEEEEEIVQIPAKHKMGKYILIVDPLDGSSNAEVNNCVGTIFSIYRRITADGRPGELEDCLQLGAHQVAAGYIVYGSSTILVYTTREGVHGFTLDPSLGEFLLSHDTIKIPKKSHIYSINEGNHLYWYPGLKEYIDYLQEEDEGTDRPYTLRYSGAMVADIHRILLTGGIFMYPADHRHPEGKLRLTYECNPMSFIVEAAGGSASDGNQRILEIQPISLHGKTPIFIGSEEDVKMAEKFVKQEQVNSAAFIN